ncbi:protein kinase domain-containing protein [Haematococcus lacustris]|uniref:Protein kinase domain-containing protein n=1 Tax=Haematococcus lacustris TaxID=44745 RepID=A0A699ZR83_HAELA|nr:protein kinase domain-containing protein [Haematococcus lacustris]
MAPVTVLGDCLALLQLPNVMAKQYINLAKMRRAEANALMQACSYCQEKGWRFTFVTCYEYTFFVWRVAEDRYAVTDGFLHDVAAYGLHTRELLAYIIWMSLEAPWGSQLPPGELRDLEVLLQQQTAVTVLRSQPGIHQGQSQQGQGSVCTRSSTWGSKQLQPAQKPTEALDAAQQRDQPFAWAPAEGAPEYPLTALRLSDIRMGAGQCGPVVQGWLWGVPVAVKATDVCKAPDIVELLWHEAQIYEVLRDLQGHVLPVMHGCGYWGGRNTFFLATAVALQAIHQRGVAHGDVRADNILVQHCGNTPQVIFIDFGQAYLHPTPEECQRELADLEAELDEL